MTGRVPGHDYLGCKLTKISPVPSRQVESIDVIRQIVRLPFRKWKFRIGWLAFSSANEYGSVDFNSLTKFENMKEVIITFAEVS